MLPSDVDPGLLVILVCAVYGPLALLWLCAALGRYSAGDPVPARFVLLFFIAALEVAGALVPWVPVSIELLGFVVAALVEVVGIVREMPRAVGRGMLVLLRLGVAWSGFAVVIGVGLGLLYLGTWVLQPAIARLAHVGGVTPTVEEECMPITGGGGACSEHYRWTLDAGDELVSHFDLPERSGETDARFDLEQRPRCDAAVVEWSVRSGGRELGAGEQRGESKAGFVLPADLTGQVTIRIERTDAHACPSQVEVIGPSALSNYRPFD